MEFHFEILLPFVSTLLSFSEPAHQVDEDDDRCDRGDDCKEEVGYIWQALTSLEGRAS